MLSNSYNFYIELINLQQFIFSNIFSPVLNFSISSSLVTTTHSQNIQKSSGNFVVISSNTVLANIKLKTVFNLNHLSF